MVIAKCEKRKVRADPELAGALHAERLALWSLAAETARLRDFENLTAVGRFLPPEVEFGICEQARPCCFSDDIAAGSVQVLLKEETAGSAVLFPR